MTNILRNVHLTHYDFVCNLQSVNNLNYTNKVIAINDFQAKYKAIKANHFIFISLGLSKIEISGSRDIDVDLYYLKKN